MWCATQRAQPCTSYIHTYPSGSDKVTMCVFCVCALQAMFWCFAVPLSVPVLGRRTGSALCFLPSPADLIQHVCLLCFRPAGRVLVFNCIAIVSCAVLHNGLSPVPTAHISTCPSGFDTLTTCVFCVVNLQAVFWCSAVSLFVPVPFHTRLSNQAVLEGE